MTEHETLERWLNQQKDALLESQKDKDIYASGKSAAATRVSMDEKGGEITGPAYWQQQEEGRRPGELPPIKAIEAWLKVRGLPYSPWAVAINIMKNGTVAFQKGGTNVISDVINEDSIDDLLNQMGIAVQKNVSSQILKTWQSR